VESKPVAAKDKPPESWKPAAREFWQKLPPEARAEIQRREAEMSGFMQKTAGQRKVAEQFIGAINPYLGMIKAEGGNPIETVQNLLATAAFLRTGPAAQKAVMVAKLVKDFGISIQDLDSALAGEQIPEDPNAKIQQLLDERLRPVNELLETVNKTKTQREEQAGQEVDTQIQAFAQDPKNEFFADVQQDMADLVEVASRRGRPITLQQAYDRAIALDPEIQATLKARVAAKKAAGGSIPLRGNKAPVSNENRTLRADLESAFESVANR
jgi:hypothetical protein